MNYEFNVGDYVEDIDGNTGYIDYICDCDECKRRGFNEPHVVYPNYDDDYIYRYELENPEKHFKRIGKYDFTKSLKEEALSSLIKEIRGNQEDMEKSLAMNRAVELVPLLRDYTDEIVEIIKDRVIKIIESEVKLSEKQKD